MGGSSNDDAQARGVALFRTNAMSTIDVLKYTREYLCPHISISSEVHSRSCLISGKRIK